MSKYEHMIIVSSTISEEDRNASIENLKAIYEANNVKIEKEDVWWMKKLAYRINKSNEGFYILFDLEIDGKAIKSITNSINLDKNIWRNMFVSKES